MTIREANPTDIPEIVQVLRASLGETALPFSKEIWNYKHVNNPFGPSIVLLAEENSKIVGVRAFMRWRWQKTGKSFSALRAVDTATHPEHQGKGIFKKLTLKAVDIAKENSENFVFNTPNDQSRPGYIKMGWEPVGKINVALQPAYFSFWKINDLETNYSVDIKTTLEGISKLCNEWNEKLTKKEKLFTPKTRDFLSWRYEKNPLQQYQVLATDNFYLAAYVKKRKNIKELRIAECIFNSEKSKGEVNKKVNEWSKKFGVQVVSFSPDLLKLKMPGVKGSFGPILTFRELNVSAGEKEFFMNVNNWSNSIGDLELF